ncbi:T9SS type A sorting domain-containing protein [Polaribacter sp. WD7]|uniref:T9SS type A sorting domain-containing protein n=1 Tax=Polaribacter sp. WD7 TaxID=2269061 RepID=UPI002161FE57|nr:T9SS type A sorting domain-containing protein [Polaribacter sp. WD7]
MLTLGANILFAQISYLRNVTTIKIKATHQIKGENTSATFYKSTKKKEITDKDKCRSWFRLKRGNTFSSILIGFVKGATNEYDRIYDGPFNINEKSLGFYSLIEGTKKATIQGLPLLVEDEKIVSLGFIVDQVGDYSIKLQEEFIEDIYYIYLEDTELGVFVDLNQQEEYPFTIDTVGENNTRFRIIYTKEKKEILSREDAFFNDNNLSVFVNLEKELIVKYPRSKEINKITLYTLLGRMVKVFETNKNKSISDLQTGVYLVKIDMKRGNSITKKIVIVN